MEVTTRCFILIAGFSVLAGCAGIDLGNDGLTYYDPEPYLLATNKEDCSQTISPITMPGEKRSLKFNKGIGSAKLNVELANGMIKTIGQDTDTQIPQTLTSIAALATAAVAEAKKCVPESIIYKQKGLVFPYSIPGPREI